MADALTATTIIAPAVKRTMDHFAKSLSQRIGGMTKAFVDKAAVDLRIGFQDYFTTSHNKCRTFKTILNPSRPIEVLDNYVNIQLSYGSEKIEDSYLISNLRKYRHIVVTGLAGGGKSMLMKYLTMCKFEQEESGKGYVAPLFVELRNLNNFTDRNLLAFIRSSSTTKHSGANQEQFELALRGGALALILDGFDEVHSQYRDEVQRQILAIRKDFPEVTIVISSRPDARFGSWQAFHVFKVNDLTKAQCLQLIGGLDYDSGVKNRFLRQVDAKLYASHHSFLSSPLLTTIMLLTYEDFAEIPQNMHSFYAQAFDTLFQKHDAQKEQYVRKTHTGLAREEFRECFAAFCALSYLNQQFSFDDKALEDTARNAVKYLKQSNTKIGSKLTARDFIFDLHESVCMLLKDGVETTFVHRSFQEYFAAVFATKVHASKVRNLLDQYAKRGADSVVAMAYEMDKDTVEQEWVLPLVDELYKELRLDGTVLLATRLSKFFVRIALHVGSRPNDMLSLHMAEITPLFESYNALRRVFPPLPDIHLEFDFRQANLIALRNDPRYQRLGLLTRIVDPSKGFSEMDDCLISLTAKDNWWLKEFKTKSVFADMKTQLSTIRKDIQQREKRRSDILQQFVKPRPR